MTLGSKLLVSCSVSSLAGVRVSWRRNNNDIQTTGNALNQTLTIANIKTTDAGDYMCEVKNEYQVIIIAKSFKLLVIVNEQVEMTLSLTNMQFHPDLLNKTSSRYINMTSLVSLEIKTVLSKTLVKPLQIVILGFTQGSIIVDFSVSISETLTSPQDKPPDLQSQVNSIMIEQANTGSFGNLIVGSLVLKVKPPPPSNLVISDRGTTFMVLSWKPPTGHQSYQINQYIVHMREQNQVVWRTTVVGSSVLLYRYTGLKANTWYEFQVTSRSPLGDGIPSAVLRDITLTVEPIVANDGQNFTVTEGESVVLVCQGSSDPRPQKVTWLKQAPLADVSTNVTGNGKILNSYMVIRKAKVDDAGSYGCRATYEDQSSEGAVHLIVNVPVAVNINVTLTKVNYTDDLKNKSSPKYKELETRVVTALENLYKNITGFKEVIVLGFSNGSVKVRFRVVIVVKIAKPDAAVKQNETKATATNFIIKQVRNSQGNLGNGLTVRKDSIETDAPPNPPRNVTVHDVKENTAHLRWSRPLYVDYFSVTHYIVKLKTHGDSEWQEKEQIASLQLDCPLENLQKDTAYNVKVLAKNNQGNGLDSVQQDFRTKDSSKLWLWILVSVAGVVLLWGGVMCFLCIRRRNIDSRLDYSTNIKPPTERQNVHLYSYKNEAFCLTHINQDAQALGLMPGKWWEIPRESLYLVSTLGSGAFGLVKKAQLRVEDGLTTCAVKMNRDTATAEDQRDLYEELHIMDGVGRHPNLVNLIGACTTSDGPLMIVLEFAENGSLIDYLHKHVTSVGEERVCSLREDEKIAISLDIARGMNHLASVKCVHRDLAARNVLLSENGQAKIADFGLSRDVYVRGFYEKTTQGKLPVRWMALEAIQQMKFTTQTDVWSYGVVLWEIETGGSKPYGVIGLQEIIDYLKIGRRLHRPVTCRQDIYDVMLQCWDIIPERRPTFNELCLKMETLTGGEVADLLY